jgi:hypothetical protein
MHTQNKVGSKKISKKLIYQVCSYIRVGTPIETAAIAAGIDKSDYHLWMREGKSSHHYDHCENCDFAMFYRQITSANGSYFLCLHNESCCKWGVAGKCLVVRKVWKPR